MGDTLAGYRPRSQVFALAAELVQKYLHAHSLGPGGGGLGGERDTRRCNCVRIVMAQMPMLMHMPRHGLSAFSHTLTRTSRTWYASARQRWTPLAQQGGEA